MFFEHVKIVGDNLTELIQIEKIIGVCHTNYTSVINDVKYFILNVSLTRGETLVFEFTDQQKCLQQFEKIEMLLQKQKDNESEPDFIDAYCQVKIRRKILDNISVEKLKEYLISHGLEFEQNHISPSTGVSYKIKDVIWNKMTGGKIINYPRIHLYQVMSAEQKFRELKIYAEASGRNVFDVLFELGSRVDVLVDVFPSFFYNGMKRNFI
jgi:hypothetical protein